MRIRCVRADRMCDTVNIISAVTEHERACVCTETRIVYISIVQAN